MINNRMSSFGKKALFIGCVLFAAGGASVYYTYQWYLEYRSPIKEFNEQRDTGPLLKLFYENWYWLVNTDNYSPEYMLKNRTPHQNPFYHGRLQIKTLYEGSKFVGFVAYWMRTAADGFILFLAVDKTFRGKRYGQLLMNYAIDQLTQEGATNIKLVTRPSNTSARALYNRLGFKEESIDDNFVYFTYYPPRKVQ